ncbi:MAG: pyridoxamine 5'-phosphate oxidase family protein [Candidatus Izimaplasma sp.]|nr:pyridoxamine 5'-phosphate oxidase family protein [Candidatus Izimaplasma bacterium]
MENQLVKFRHGNSKGVFYYVIFEGDFVALADIRSPKINYIKSHGAIDLAFDMDSETYDLMEVDIITDKPYVKKIYNYMMEKENTYFKDGTEGLCVLKFHR